jgi:hypothetical protein
MKRVSPKNVSIVENYFPFGRGKGAESDHTSRQILCAAHYISRENVFLYPPYSRNLFARCLPRRTFIRDRTSISHADCKYGNYCNGHTCTDSARRVFERPGSVSSPWWLYLYM